GGVREVLDLLRNQRLQAAILFSDGRQVGEEPVIATSLSGGGIPIHTVLTAPSSPDSPIRDAAIARIEMPSPPNVFVGETFNATAHVVWTATSATPKPQEITLSVGAYQLRAPVEPTEGSPKNGLHRGVARFSLQFDDPGPTRITFSLKPDKKELTDVNNSV